MTYAAPTAFIPKFVLSAAGTKNVELKPPALQAPKRTASAQAAGTLYAGVPPGVGDPI